LVSIDTKMETRLKIIDVLDKNKNGVHIRELSRIVKTSYNNIIRNIKILESKNIIRKEKEANLIRIKLKNNPLTIAYLKQVHTENFLELPKKISISIIEFINELEIRPLITLIFGSYSKKNFTKESDIDIFLVFQKTENQISIENTAKRISMRTNLKINPIYVNYFDFEKNMLNKEHIFSNEIRNNIILLNGLEDYYSILWRFYE